MRDLKVRSFQRVKSTITWGAVIATSDDADLNLVVNMKEEESTAGELQFFGERVQRTGRKSGRNQKIERLSASGRRAL